MIPLEILRGVSGAIRTAGRASGASRRAIVAETKGVSAALRGDVAAGTSTKQIVRNLKSLRRTVEGGRLSPSGSRPDVFRDEALMHGDFAYEHSARRAYDPSYDPKTSFYSATHEPKVPRGTVRPSKATPPWSGGSSPRGSGSLRARVKLAARTQELAQKKVKAGVKGRSVPGSIMPSTPTPRRIGPLTAGEAKVDDLFGVPWGS